MYLNSRILSESSVTRCGSRVEYTGGRRSSRSSSSADGSGTLLGSLAAAVGLRTRLQQQ
jgi:hypothetical protein